MRRRYVYRNGEAIEITDSNYVPIPMIQPDIAPYRSMATGEVIESRAKHREHLKRHGLVEVGNQTSYTPKTLPDVSPQRRKELIRAQVDAMRDSDFRRALRRDIDNVKWNSGR